MVWAAFLARVKPVSTRAKPACMNMTRKPVIRVQMMLMEILLWPTASAISARIGLPASLAVMSLTVPVVVPAGSGASVTAGAAAAAGAVAGSSALTTKRQSQHDDHEWSKIKISATRL